MWFGERILQKLLKATNQTFHLFHLHDSPEFSWWICDKFPDGAYAVENAQADNQPDAFKGNGLKLDAVPLHQNGGIRLGTHPRMR